MASTGALFVKTGTNAGSGVAWSNPGNITADDATLASVSLTAPSTSQYLVGNNLGLSLPHNATINGIEVTLDALANTAQQSVYLTKNGTATVGTSKATSFTGTISTLTYGSSSDLWGTTWTPAEINATTFGAIFSVGNLVSGTRPYSVDFIKINIYYTLSPQNPNFFQFI